MRPSLRLIDSGMTNEIPTAPSWRKPLSDYLAWMRAAGRPDSTLYQRSYQLRRFAHETHVEPFEATLDLLVEYLGSHVWGKATQHVSKLISTVLPDGVTAHMLRHRFASRAYGAQRDIRAVQELLGHASVATTQVYTKVPDGALRAGVEAAA